MHLSIIDLLLNRLTTKMATMPNNLRTYKAHELTRTERVLFKRASSSDSVQNLGFSAQRTWCTHFIQMRLAFTGLSSTPTKTRNVLSTTTLKQVSDVGGGLDLEVAQKAASLETSRKRKFVFYVEVQTLSVYHVWKTGKS